MGFFRMCWPYDLRNWMPWYAAFSPAFFAFFATPPATRIPVPDMTTVTRVRRAARLEVCEAAATSLVSEKNQAAAPSAERPPRPPGGFSFFSAIEFPGEPTNSRGFRRRARGSR